MRTFSLPAVLVYLAVLLPSVGVAAPLVTFSPASLTVTPSATFDTPPIVVQNATGVSMVELSITIPSDIIIDTSRGSDGNLACVSKGSSVGGLYFAEWKSALRKIMVTCNVTSGSSLEIVKSISFTAPASITTEDFALTGSVTGGSGSPTFTSLTIEPPHTVSFTTSPAVTTATINSSGSTTCSAAATDSRGHAVTYTWSDGGKGGSFTPSAASQNPTYTVAANVTGANVSVTLTCVASCPQDSSVKATGQASLTVRPKFAGDVDKDNDVDKTDADLVLQYLFGDIAKTAEMDANGDGSVTISDAQWILAHPHAAS